MLYMFDVDGTLIEGFLRNWGEEGRQPEHGSEVEAVVYDRVELLPDRYETIGRLATLKFSTSWDIPHFALVTNQAGVAFGYQSVEQVYDKMGRVVAALEGFHSCPFSIHICFHHEKATVPEWQQNDPSCRKPNPGMLIAAMRAHNVGPDASIFVGDLPTDEQAAAAVGVEYRDAGGFFG